MSRHTPKSNIYGYVRKESRGEILEWANALRVCMGDFKKHPFECGICFGDGLKTAAVWWGPARNFSRSLSTTRAPTPPSVLAIAAAPCILPAGKADNAPMWPT